MAQLSACIVVHAARRVAVDTQSLRRLQTSRMAPQPNREEPWSEAAAHQALFVTIADPDCKGESERQRLGLSGGGRS